MAANGERRRSKSVCIFCRGTDLSREHVWARWTWEVVPPDNQVVQRQKGTFSAMGGRGGPTNRTVHPSKVVAGNLRRRRAKVVCVGCNSGWMSVLEQQIKAVIGPVLTGTDLTWSVADLRLISLWVEKTALVHEADNRKGSAPRWMRHRLRSSLVASPESRIWVAKTDDPWWSAGTITRSFSFGLNVRAALAVTTMSLGPLVFIVMTPYGPHGIPGSTAALPTSRAAMRRIWPTAGPLKTADLPVLTGADLQPLWTALAHALDHWPIWRTNHPFGIKAVPLGMGEPSFAPPDKPSPRRRPARQESSDQG